jgi:hypothetical protein
VLLTATGYGNLDITRRVPMDDEAVGLWRRRWFGCRGVPLGAISVTERLANAAASQSGAELER